MTTSRTGIEWTDATWNPVTGCSKVSPGCAHCYAETVAQRFWPSQYPDVEVETGGPAGTETRSRRFTDVECHEDRLDQPLRWRRPRRIFVNSMSDLFHEDVPDAFIDRVFAVMALAPQHTFQVLTKRAERMREYFAHERKRKVAVAAQAFNLGKTGPAVASKLVEYQNYDAWPLPNVWLGVSVENQHFADERIPLLLQTPAAVRFISAEPLLGPVDLTNLQVRVRDRLVGDSFVLPKYDALRTIVPPHLDLVIAGLESHGRPGSAEWVVALQEQCRAAGVAFFAKQYGSDCRVGYYDRRWRDFYEARGCDWPEPIGWNIDREGQPPHDAVVRLRFSDRKGGDPQEWPADLRVRQFPEARQ